jgi:hypothetical protein
MVPIWPPLGILPVLSRGVSLAVLAVPVSGLGLLLAVAVARSNGIA